MYVPVGFLAAALVSRLAMRGGSKIKSYQRSPEMRESTRSSGNDTRR